MISFDDFKKVVLKIIETNENQEKHRDSIPYDYCDVLFYNEHHELQYKLTDTLIEMLLGKSLYDEVSWYLYDRSTKDPKIESDNGVFMIYNVWDFFNYIEIEYYV